MIKFLNWLLGREGPPLYVIETKFGRLWNVDEKIIAHHAVTARQDYEYTVRAMTPDEIRKHR